MNKAKIVLFKADSEDDDEYLKLFKCNQLDAYCLSPIKFKFNDLDTLAAKLVNNFKSNYSALVITSPRILQVLKYLNQDNKLSLECLRSLPCLTVGPQTFKKLNDDFQHMPLINNIDHNINNGKDLACYLNDHLEEVDGIFIRPLLYPTSNLSKDELRNHLNEAVKIEKLVCYETLPNHDLDKDLDNLLKSLINTNYTNEDVERDFLFVFFSPSGFYNFKENVNFIRTDKLKLIAIGPTTKKAIEDNHFNLIATSSKPTPESLLETVLKCISNS